MKRANEKDAHRLHGQLNAAFDLLELESACTCTEGVRPRVTDAGDPVTDQDGRPVFDGVPTCKTKLDHALRVARQAAGVGNSGKERTTGGPTPNPTLAAVMAQFKADGTWKPHMGPDWWYDSLLSLVTVLNTAAGNLSVLCLDLAKITTTDPKDLGKNGQGVCPVCDHFCSGAVNDRLISNLCGTDYQAWRRAGFPDRFEFIRTRRAALAS